MPACLSVGGRRPPSHESSDGDLKMVRLLSEVTGIGMIEPCFFVLSGARVLITLFSSIATISIQSYMKNRRDRNHFTIENAHAHYHAKFIALVEQENLPL